LFSTHLITEDGRKIICPNSDVTNQNIVNYSYEGAIRVDYCVVGIGYSDDIDLAKRAVIKVLHDDERVLDTPPAVVAVESLGDNSVNILVYPWVHPDNYFNIRWDLYEKIKIQFDELGINIPFPQRDVHLRFAGVEDDGEGQEKELPAWAKGEKQHTWGDDDVKDVTLFTDSVTRLGTYADMLPRQTGQTETLASRTSTAYSRSTGRGAYQPQTSVSSLEMSRDSKQKRPGGNHDDMGDDLAIASVSETSEIPMLSDQDVSDDNDEVDDGTNGSSRFGESSVIMRNSTSFRTSSAKRSSSNMDMV
jgi:Mechanosensitive ion channel MscS, C-terminal/Mechanosensitive ion channel, beta-domain